MAVWTSTLESMVTQELPSRLPEASFWKDKRVLVTGHTGFKGGWLATWLNRLGANVAGISLPPNTQPNFFELSNLAKNISSHFCDIRDLKTTSQLIKDFCPEIVFHLAAQALVRESYLHPIETFSTNVMGTAHVLEALRGLSNLKVAIIVTSDKVYRNDNLGIPFNESNHLGGHDPYSASKAASELIVASYRDSFLADQGVGIATARAGNVIGGGDWSSDRLVPDALRAWETGAVLTIRRPNAIRPWQHVLEPLAGYLMLAEKLYSYPHYSGAWNFGPARNTAATVREVAELMNFHFRKGVDNQIAWGCSSEGPHEAQLLSLDASKAKSQLGISGRWSLSKTVEYTMNWYEELRRGASAIDLCEADIQRYETNV